MALIDTIYHLGCAIILSSLTENRKFVTYTDGQIRNLATGRLHPMNKHRVAKSIGNRDVRIVVLFRQKSF